MKQEKIKSLQGLRALAMLGIFLFHAGFLFGGAFPVTFFFILSGFVIFYTNHLNSYKLSLWGSIKWAVDKIKKFYPIHIMTLFMSIVIRWSWLQQLGLKDLTIGLALNLLLLQGLFIKYQLYFNALSWFLSVIFIIYIFAIPLIMLIKRFSLGTCFAGILIVLIIQYGSNFYSLNIDHLELYSDPLYRIFDFTLGMLLSKIFILHKTNSNHILNKINRNKLITNICEFIILIIFVYMYIFALKLRENFAYYQVLFCAILLIFPYENGLISKFLSINIFQKFAAVSFEFYMFHELILIIFRRVFEQISESWPISIYNIIVAVPSFIIALCAAYIVNKFIIEIKITKRSTKLFRYT